MASIVNYFANGTKAGSKESVMVKMFIFLNVGEGKVTKIEPFSFSFQGKIKSAFFNGPLSIAIKLTDEETEAAAGKCAIMVNDTSDQNAGYRIDGSSLKIDCILDGTKQSITIFQISDEQKTQIELVGKYDYTIRLVPAS